MSRTGLVHCAAVDLGATSGRVILGTWNGESLDTAEVHRFPNSIRSLGTHEYWDIPGIWMEVKTGLAKAAAAIPRRDSLASVGVDTWGVDHVLVNESGRIVFPTHAYRDARTRRGLRSLLKDRESHRRIYAATGIPAVFYNTSLQLAETIASCPELARTATRCLFLPDYFNYLLSGKMANGLAISSTSQLLDVHTGSWSGEALEHFGVPSSWFTPPVGSCVRLGKVRGIAGLESCSVVAVPGHDTACAFEAMPSGERDEDLFISSGTWSLVGFKSGVPMTGDGALKAGISNERAGDGRWRPLTNVIGLWLIERVLAEFSKRPADDSEWSELIRQAASRRRPSCLLDVNDPAFVNPASMRRSIDVQLRRIGAVPPRDLAGYVRLICESLGQAHARVMRRLEQLRDRRFERIVIVGGGTKNRLLCQATADATGLPVLALEVEGSALGNLASQLVALKAIGSFSEFRTRVVRLLPAQTYEPDLRGKSHGVR